MQVAVESAFDVGTILDGRYRVIDVLGEGGMSTVYLCEHTLIRRYVAVKVMHAGLAEDRKAIERFLNEARAAGTLGHPNIIESTDMGFVSEGRIPYIVFEHLEGALLTDEIYRLGGFPVKRAVEIAHQIASALGAAHEAAIVHRDIKSDNVFLVEQEGGSDFVKVLDFGISKFLQSDRHTRSGVTMGTPEFMSPEQITNPDDVDHRADIYALGVILYEMLEGRRPFRAIEDPRVLLHKIVHTEPPPFGRAVPEELQTLVFRMLSKDPALRPQTSAAVEQALSVFAPPVRRPSRSLQRLTPRPFATPSQPPATRTPSPHFIKQLTSQDIPIHRTRTIDPQTPVSLPMTPNRRTNWVAGGLAVGIAAVGVAVAVIMLTRDKGPSTEPRPSPAMAMATPAPAPEKFELQIGANVPESTVTFRRRVTAAPIRMQLASSDIVELVEISAPGYKTVRYWITMDRATRLQAKLEKGEGIIEPSELETLVALGEANESALGKAKTDAAAAVAALQKRKIGPAAAKPVEVAKATPKVVEPAKSTEPKLNGRTEPKSTQPTELAKIAKIDPKTTKPEPVQPKKIETTKALNEPIKVEPPKAEPPKVELPKAVAATAIEASRLAGSRMISPDDTTKVTIQNNGNPKIVTAAKLCLSNTGAVQGITILKSSGFPTYDQRIQREMQAWRFKPVLVDGKPTAVCTSVTFIYNQK